MNVSSTGVSSRSSYAFKRYIPILTALVCLLAFYYRGLDCYFYQDDFGWLHLGPAHGFRDFLSIAFAPKAHGNLRPWSENLFFYTLKSWFGPTPLPFRIVVFLTVAADLVLLDAIARRLTGSRWAGGVAALCWLLNPCVAPTLCWTCIYNQPQSLCFLLAAFFLFLQGRERAALLVFVLGLGSLETVVVFPLLLSVYALLYDRPRLRRILPLYAISSAYAALHFLVTPPFQSGPYAIRADARIPHTLWTYTEMVLGPERLGHFLWDWPQRLFPAATALLGLLLLTAVAFRTTRRLALIGAAWFLLLLAPMLVLPDHIMDYALTGPAAGLALILAGLAATRKAYGLPVVTLYLAFAAPAAWRVTKWNWERSHLARDLVEGVLRCKRAQPDKLILLTGMDTDQFLAGFADLPFEVHGYHDIWLAPGAEANIRDPNCLAPRMVYDRRRTEAALRQGQARILSVTAGQVQDITAAYRLPEPPPSP